MTLATALIKLCLATLLGHNATTIMILDSFNSKPQDLTLDRFPLVYPPLIDKATLEILKGLYGVSLRRQGPTSTPTP
jgi:hypothetical protein